MKEYNLVGVDGNAFSVMGYVLKAMRECGLNKSDQDHYKKEAMSSDYDNLIRVSILMVDRCNEIVRCNSF